MKSEILEIRTATPVEQIGFANLVEWALPCRTAVAGRLTLCGGGL